VCFFLEHDHAVSGVDGVLKAAAADSAANLDPHSKTASVASSGEDDANIDSSCSTQIGIEDTKKRTATESSDPDGTDGFAKKQKAGTTQLVTSQ